MFYFFFFLFCLFVVLCWASTRLKLECTLRIPPDMANGKSMQLYYDYVATDEIRKFFGAELQAKALQLEVSLPIFSDRNWQNG